VLFFIAMPTPPKLHTPLPSDTEGRVAWLFQNAKAMTCRSQLYITIATSPGNAETIMEFAPPNAFHASQSGMQRVLRSRRPGLEWMRQLWEEHKSLYSGSQFALSFSEAKEKLATWLRDRDALEAVISVEVENRQGHAGCAKCKKTTGPMHYAHIDPTTKIGMVSTLLMDGKWSLAQREGLKCQKLCVACHVEKNKQDDHPYRKRKPFDPTLESRRASVRKCAEKCRRRGELRAKKAKLERGACATCQKICVAENISGFVWDHLDPSSKRYQVNQMVTCSDATFNAELSKCVLRCVECDDQLTRKQRNAGLFYDPRRKNFNKQTSY
jgi:hypothetical protein